jgi:hypothetical protein
VLLAPSAGTTTEGFAALLRCACEEGLTTQHRREGFLLFLTMRAIESRKALIQATPARSVGGTTPREQPQHQRHRQCHHNHE